MLAESLGPTGLTVLQHPAMPPPSLRNRGGVLSSAELNEFGIAAADAIPIVDWTACGTCEWMIDGAGCLTIRPANGAESGELDATIPWSEYHDKVRAVEVTGKVKAQTLKRAFYKMTNLVRADLSNLDTSNVSCMKDAFLGCESLVSIDLSNWNTSHVTDEFGMTCMFAYCSSLESLDLSNWDMSNVTDISIMFAEDSSLRSLNLSGWDTSSVTDMLSMLNNCVSLVSIEGLSGWDTSNVWSLEQMFSGCSSLTSLDLSDWDTSKVTMMYGTFSGCSSLKSLNLSSWDASNAYMGNMFSDCSSLRMISLSDSFAFTEDPEGRYSVFLPTPVGEGLTGKWVSSVDGKAYAPEEVPSNVAATYTAEGAVFPDPVQAFPDVDYSQWYADGVTFCSEKGLITGYTTGEDAGKFGVGRTLTRAQLAAILWRNAEPEAAEAYDSDAANVTGMSDVADNEWYTGAANWAVKAKVINGSDKGDHREFCPNDPVTAEQLAAILANYADPAGAENADLGVLDGFADSGDISDWARGSVAWAKSKSIINGYDEGGVRLLKPYEEIARERVATILMNAFESGVLK